MVNPLNSVVVPCQQIMCGPALHTSHKTQPNTCEDTAYLYVWSFMQNQGFHFFGLSALLPSLLLLLRRSDRESCRLGGLK